MTAGPGVCWAYAVRSPHTMTTPTPTDDDFARYVKQVAMVTPAQVDVAEQELRRQLGSGITVPMGEILVRQGAITQVQREGVEKRLVARQAGGLQQLGPYQILRKLGEGGMGAVYLAADTAHGGRQVALKVLPKRHAGDAEFVSRFKREARSAIGLAHPHIVAAYAVGEDFGVHWYAMEFCPGEALDTRLKRAGRLPWEAAVKLTAEIAAGLAHAHAQGIIHRDIKPANIVIAANGAAKILDFGLAKQLGGGQSLMTQTGVVMGTPHYIAPEQARGDKQIDGRADLYALGATLYHLITGHPPFSGSSPAAVIMRHLNEELPDPRASVPDLPVGVVEVIRRMMAKQPAQRHPDGQALIADLARVMTAGMRDGGQVAASATALARHQAAVGGPDHRLAYVLCAVVVSLLVLGWWWLRPTLNPLLAEERAPAPVAMASSSPEPSPVASLLAPVAPASPTSAPAVAGPPAAAVGNLQARVIDLLPLIDPARDAVYGIWSRVAGALVSDASGSWEAGKGAARLVIRYQPPEEYDFRIVFTRLSGNHCVSQVFVARQQAFAWMMGGWGSSVAAFENYRGGHGNEAANITRVAKADCLVTGRRHEAVVRVRRDGATALLDGQVISRTPADFAGMTTPGIYHLGLPGALGLASWASPTRFAEVQVVEHSGPGKPLR